MHLGLSPFYKGSATLFWPFYFLEPQFAGVTFHKISKKVDAGDILHQCTPSLEYGDKIHTVSAKAVIEGTDSLLKLIKIRKNNIKWNFYPQKRTGKLFLSKDFQPHHLRLIYNLYQNKIVDKFLSNELSKKIPDLINGLK